LAGRGIVFSVYSTHTTNEIVSLVALFLVVIRALSYFYTNRSRRKRAFKMADTTGCSIWQAN
jgi:hypothetical protein